MGFAREKVFDPLVAQGWYNVSVTEFIKFHKVRRGEERRGEERERKRRRRGEGEEREKKKRKDELC